MESFTCTTKYDSTKTESTVNTINNYYGDLSFQVGSTGLNGKSWANINVAD